MHKLTELFLKNRGYTSEYLKEIDNPEHVMLKDIDALSNALRTCRENSENIVIIPDFDMDGIMSGVVGFAGLSELGFNVSLFIPDPKDGYGFTKNSIERLLREYPNTNAIITCDVGIDCHDGIWEAKRNGLKIFVTDHHKVLRLPDADVVVDPMREDDEYEHKGICGAYVLYQCLQYYADKYESAFLREQIFRLRVFAGIGTISDSMPVLYENRTLIRDAIAVCRYIYAEGDSRRVDSLPGCNVYRRAFRGLYDVLSVFADEGKLDCPDNIDETFFGFYLAPTFNAVKRMNGNMEDAFGAFFGADRMGCITNLYSLNEERKLMVQAYYDAMNERTQPYAPYIYITDAPSGLLGLLAMRKMQETGEPTIVVYEDNAGFHGSGRSPSWYPFLSRVGKLSIYAAGHEGAFGVGINTESELMVLYMFLLADVPMWYEAAPKVEANYDFVISSLGDGDTYVDIPAFSGFLHDIKSLRPFGQGFPEPHLLLRFRANEGEWTQIGSNKQHLKINLPHGFSILCWNQAGTFLSQKYTGNDIVECEGNLSMNEFQGASTINFIGNI